MGNRILKESICASETIDQLTPLEEVSFYRLLVNCDDYGLMDGRIPVLKARMYPLRDMRHEQLAAVINKLASVGLVTLYAVDGKPFIRIANWDRHQQVRNHKSRYPKPDDGCEQLKSIDINCNHPISIAPLIQSNPIRIQSVSESNPYPDTEIEGGAGGTDAVASAPALPSPRPEKHKYGEYKNVLLTDAELERLKAEFPSDWQAWIETLSEGIASKGYKYASHLAAIRAWAKRDKENTGTTKAPVKTVSAQRYTQREYDPADAGSGALVDLLAEARRFMTP
jgi:hypothetical protein